MGVTRQEYQKVPNLKHEEVYKRIKEYYIGFILRWNNMTEIEKSEYIFGNGRKSSIDYVNKSATYLKNLPELPSLQDSIDLGQNVIHKSLEYSYHDEDDYGIKMGAYAHYLINIFNDGKHY